MHLHRDSNPGPWNNLYQIINIIVLEPIVVVVVAVVGVVSSVIPCEHDNFFESFELTFKLEPCIGRVR